MFLFRRHLHNAPHKLYRFFQHNLRLSTSSHTNNSAILTANTLARSVDDDDDDDNVAERKESDVEGTVYSENVALDCKNRKERRTWVKISCLVVNISRLVVNISPLVVYTSHLVIKISRLAVKISHLVVDILRLVVKVSRLVVNVSRLVVKISRLVINILRLLVNVSRLMAKISRLVVKLSSSGQNLNEELNNNVQYRVELLYHIILSSSVNGFNNSGPL